VVVAAQEFVKSYDVEFPMMNKIKVNGSSAEPLFVFLKSKLSGSFGSFIKWYVDGAGLVPTVCKTPQCRPSLPPLPPPSLLSTPHASAMLRRTNPMPEAD